MGGVKTALKYDGQAIFRYAGLDIRVTPGIDNQPRFSLADVYAALGLTPSTTLAGKLLERDLLDYAVVDTAAGTHVPIEVTDGAGVVYLTMIAESVRSCIDARAFKRWVFNVPMKATRQVRPGDTGPVVEFQFPRSHSAAVVLADLMERG